MCILDRGKSRSRPWNVDKLHLHWRVSDHHKSSLFRDWTPSLQFTVQYPHGDQRPQWPSILTKKHQNWTGSYVLMLVFKCIRGLKINFPPCLTWTFAGIAFNVVILNAICIRFATTGLRWTAVAIPLSSFITVTITGTKRTPACPRI